MRRDVDWLYAVNVVVVAVCADGLGRRLPDAVKRRVVADYGEVNVR